jgi:hypothetical protein
MPALLAGLSDLCRTQWGQSGPDLRDGRRLRFSFSFRTYFVRRDRMVAPLGVIVTIGPPRAKPGL